MGAGDDREGEGAHASAERRVVYCVIPADLASKLHDPLRRHFRDDADIEVIVERRDADRRKTGDRRVQAGEAPEGEERRRITGPAGRRVGERRAALVNVAEKPTLPRRARPHADRIAFLQRLEPPDLHREDLDSARLVLRAQGGERDAFATIYMRYFDRVYVYLRSLLSDRHEAEDATQQVFMKVMEALSGYDPRLGSFRAWLFTVVRNHALSLLRTKRRLEVVEPAELDSRLDREHQSEEQLRALDWITDKDLLIFVERLPMVQRQVLFMRFLFGLSHSEIATILDRRPDDVRAIQKRAVAFLRARLSAVGREPRASNRRGMLARTRRAHVLRSRRFSLHP